VSGGSLTNGFVGQEIDFNDVDGAAFEAKVTKPFMRQIVHHGTLFANCLTKAYLGFLIVLALGGLVGPWLLPVWWAIRLGLFVIGALVVGSVAWLRGAICIRAFRAALFAPAGQRSRLMNLCGTVDHVLCATDLRSGDHVYFARDIVYGYRFGVADPATVDLATAVYASAALPGAFPPLRLRINRGGFAGMPMPSGPRKPPKKFVLVDGGVYDNMADQWGSGHAEREACLPARYAGRRPDILIVANASAGMVWSEFPSIRVPILREITALLRDKTILYDNTTAHRRTALIERFDLAEQLGEGQRGAYVGIDQSPFRVAERWKSAPEPWSNRATRAATVLEALGETSDAWHETTRVDRTIGTQLSRMDPTDVARLVYHAYVTAMCNLHVILDYPLLPIPDRARFDLLVA
jgi:hypothetical protein